MKRRLFLPAIAAALAVAVWSVSLAAEQPAAETIDVTIFHVNDAHGHLEPQTESGRSVGGYARVSTVVKDARASEKAARIFLVHAGDEFSRGDDLTRRTLGAANVAVMNLLGFDAWTPGNGDFYDGAKELRARIGEAKFPALAANVKFKERGDPVGKPYVIERAGPVRIAMLGLCFVQPQDISYEEYQVAGVLDTAKQLVPELRKQADVVVAVAHLGVVAEQRLAEMVAGIDVVIGAHTHLLLRKGNRTKGPDGRDVLLTQAGEHLQFLGRIDLHMAKADGGYRIAKSEARLIAMDEKVKLDPAVTAVIAKLAEASSTPPEAPPVPAAAK